VRGRRGHDEDVFYTAAPASAPKFQKLKVQKLKVQKLKVQKLKVQKLKELYYPETPDQNLPKNLPKNTRLEYFSIPPIPRAA